MKKLLLLLSIVLGTALNLSAQLVEDEAPLLRFAVCSDIHNELTMISASDQSKLRLRPAFLTTLDSLKRAEKLDFLVLDGDYTSDVTISYSNWLRIREMMAEATRAMFDENAERKPVIWVTGNHDYEVANFDKIPKPYNAADYYTFPMKEDVGVLKEDECFYEKASNGSGTAFDLLVGFHYVLNGFDIVGLNCGKYFFTYAWDYRYSAESVEWVDKKLAEITAENPNKTIIFVAHLPLPSSVGAQSSKTLSKNDATSYELEKVLAKYPGVIYLYGHDHSSSQVKSYYESTLLQRMTFYDTNANTYVPETSGEEQEPDEDDDVLRVTIQSTENGRYLGYNSYNAYVGETPFTYEITPNAGVPGTNVVYCPETGISDNSGTQNYLYCGSSGRYSANSALSEYASHYFYEVQTAENGAEGTLVETPEAGKTYVIVTLSSKGGYYALTNEVYSEGSSSQRLVGVAVGDPAENATQTFAFDNVFWTLNLVEPSTTEPEEPGETVWQNLNADFQSVDDDTYLGFDQYNLTTLSTPNAFAISKSSVVENTFICYASNGPTSDNGKIYCGSNGRFSGNNQSVAASSILFYEVNEETLEGVRTDKPEYGKTYALVALSTSGGYYALTNTHYDVGSTSNRMVGLACTNADTQTFSSAKALWRMTEHYVEPVELGDPSFMSAFVGSMRYNSLDTNATPGEADSPIIQTMVVTLYKDRIVFTVKNIGQTGTITGKAITAYITDPLDSYVIYREVRGTTAPDTPTMITQPTTSMSAAESGYVYNLAGMRLAPAKDVATLPAGIYVVNGRKVVK